MDQGDLRRGDLEIWLSFPPSINDYYGTNRHLVKYVKPKGKKYRVETAERIGHQFPTGPIIEQLHLEVVLFMPDNRVRDLDNYMKSLLDACTEAQLWEDDSQIDQLAIYRGSTITGGAVRLTLALAGPKVPFK